MPKPKGHMHQVTVTARKDGDGFSFSPDSQVWSGASGHFAFNKDDHHMRKHDYHLVEFDIDDQTGEGLKFPRSPEDAMWVAKVHDPQHPTCPDGSSPSDYSVIDPMCVCDDGERLIVRNENPREEDWSFTLNFEKTSAGGGERVSWDPIIKNGGGGGA
ncbi:MAG TPA: hypothetical protein VIK68_11405 [Sphingomicrobium sp.]